jgi:hypothetical protein
MVAEPQLLLEREIVTLDPPPQLRELHHSVERHALGAGVAEIVIAVRRSHAHTVEAGCERRGTALPPRDVVPGFIGPTEGPCSGGCGLVLAIAAILARTVSSDQSMLRLDVNTTCSHLIVIACFFRKTGFHFFEACASAIARRNAAVIDAVRRRGTAP